MTSETAEVIAVEVPHAFRLIVEHLAALAASGPRFDGPAEELAYLVAKSTGLLSAPSWQVTAEGFEQSWTLKGNALLIVDAIKDQRVQGLLEARGVLLFQRLDRHANTVADGGYITTMKKKG